MSEVLQFDSKVAIDTRLFLAYRAVLEQGFIPIFASDDFEAEPFVESCVAAGCRVIEYTLRRRDASTMIPWIRANYPDLYLLVGSTLDDATMIEKMRGQHPQLLTLEQLADMDIDGFVSMVGWHYENIRKYAATHLVMPMAMTLREAFRQVAAGAAFAKVFGTNLEFVQVLQGAGGFRFCPTFATGGVTRERIPDAIEAGATILASGLEVVAGGCPGNRTPNEVASMLKDFLETTRAAREVKSPGSSQSAELDPRAWLATLTHVHHF